MTEYLKHFSYSNATTKELWKKLEEHSGKQIKNMMSTWTKQIGFPVLFVSLQHDGIELMMKISQKRFSMTGNLGIIKINFYNQKKLNILLSI